MGNVTELQAWSPQEEHRDIRTTGPLAGAIRPMLPGFVRALTPARSQMPMVVHFKKRLRSHSPPHSPQHSRRSISFALDNVMERQAWWLREEHLLIPTTGLQAVATQQTQPGCARELTLVPLLTRTDARPLKHLPSLNRQPHFPPHNRR